MEWAERLNHVMDYVESRLADSMDEREIGRIAACPYSQFQYAFSQAAGLSFSEYVRRRRFTMAAWELQNTDARVVDVALKYGYTSPDAFRVAFRRLHGISPSEVRRPGASVTFFCRLRFELKVTGVERMRYTMERRGPFRVVGVRRVTPYGGGTWAVVKADGSGEAIHALSGRFFDLGLCFGFGEDGSNDYMCAVEWPGEAKGFDVYDYPESTWLCFEVRGRISDNVLGDVWRRINEEFFPQSRYIKCGSRQLPTIEQYVRWDEAADDCHVVIRIPVDEK